MVILSGGYLYFFDKPKSLEPSSYFYIKNAVIITDDIDCKD